MTRVVLDIAFALALVAGLALCGIGSVAAFISASANMSFDNPLPRAGVAFLLGGVALFAIGVWGLRA